MRDRRHARRQVADDLHPVKRHAAIAVAVTGNQQFWRDLAEPVTGPADAEIRRTAGKNTANRRGGQHGDDRFRNVGYIGGDTIALANADGLHPAGKAHDPSLQRGSCQAVDPAIFAMRRNGQPVIGASQHVLGIA